MTTETAKLTTKLLDCIAADEAEMDAPDFHEVDSVRGPGWGNRGDCPICGGYQFDGTEDVTDQAWYDHAERVHQRARILATCAAHRAIVELTFEHAAEIDQEWGCGHTPAEIREGQRFDHGDRTAQKSLGILASIYPASIQQGDAATDG